jgi:photosynthetic reaction center cytochrome c subunit
MRLAVTIGGAAIAALLTVAMLFTAGWSHPPILGKQIGFRGLGMDQITTERAERALRAANALPDSIPTASPDGPKATEVYKNVQVLTDLSVDQFNTLMAAITTWVAPDQGCAYCHNTDDLSKDDIYAKRVARRMIQMTREINTQWKPHVADTGVVCWTCHRGAPIPRNIWYQNVGWPQAGGFATNNYGLGHPSLANGSTALEQDPFGPLLDKAADIRVQATKALPVMGSAGAPILSTEDTYSLMISLSNALGVNCTFCHNTREFGQWAESTPQRVTAWHGIQMVRALNATYLAPLKDTFPPERLGSHGDAPMLNCATCHQGASKPLLGVSLAKDYPELGGTRAPK